MTILKFVLGALLFVTVVFAANFYIFPWSKSVSVTHPIRGLAVQAVYATGIVESEVMLPVAPRISSRLMELFFDEEHQVHKDAVLARLEDTELKEDLIDAKARADLAQKDYDRLAALVQNGAVSRQSFDQAYKELQSAQAVVDKIKASLSYLTLLAPDEGTVIRRDGEVGELIMAGQPVFWLAGTKKRVAAEVDEEDIAQVRAGQKVLISADAYPGEIFEGTVQSITPKGDPVARSYRVRITLPDSTKLMIGMTAESNIITSEDENALLVPASALRDGMVWFVEDGAVYKKAVKTGAQNDDIVQILDGVDESNLIVEAPMEDLQAGEAVKTRLIDWNALLYGLWLETEDSFLVLPGLDQKNPINFTEGV